MEAKQILICGHRAFSACGLCDLLSTNGHSVTQFSRGELKHENNTVTGNVSRIHKNPLFDEKFDTVINFIILKFESLDKNLAYLKSLLQFCLEKKVKHLIHISSMSVYPDYTKVYTENIAMKTDPAACGAYAGIKVASDLFLMKHVPPAMKLSLIRPAFIIGPEISNPVGSIGMKFSNRYLMPLSRKDRLKPLITRSVMHQALSQVAEYSPTEQQEILLFVDPHLPSIYAYLEACCEISGVADKVVSVPTFMWVPLYLIKEIKKAYPNRFLVKQFINSLTCRLKLQQYNPSKTEKRLGMSLHSDWRAELRK